MRATTWCIKLVSRLIVVAGFASTCAAFAAEPTLGTGYLKAKHPQTAESGSKVEVTEFFSYHCPHCYSLDPALNAWVAKHKSDVLFKRVHVAWGEPGSSTQRTMKALQRGFYTLTALGKEAQFHKKLFDAFQVQHLPLYSDEQVSAFLIKQGLDQASYVAASRSFSVESNMQRALQSMQKYELTGVPNLVVDGRFVTSPSLAALGVTSNSELADDAKAIKVLDTLVAAVKAERAPAVASKPAKKK